MAESETQRITYLSKKPIECPVCAAKLNREDLLSGGGRLIAGNLSEELRRDFEPTARYGEVLPLIYPVTVCPTCCYAAYQQDFLRLPEERRSEAEAGAQRRTNGVGMLCGDLDFTEPRRLQEGLASYFAAMMSYEYFDAEVSPTFKTAVSCLRAAWLSNDMHKRQANENYSKAAILFYRKARFFYRQTLNREQAGDETLDGAGNFGPDIDKNYGYDGILYLTGLLEFKYGPKKPPETRLANLEVSKRYVSKVFGMGKASRAKPSALLEKSKDLYEMMNTEISELQSENAT